MQRLIVAFGVLCVAGGLIANVNCQELGERSYDPGEPYCFQFTWLGSIADQANSSRPCGNATGVPCFEPVVVSDIATLPDTNRMWQEMYNRSSIACHMGKGSACIKYTYTYNNAVQNISYFCGKMVENKATPIVEGCFSQQADSHIIEACACTSAPGAIPCNSADDQLPSMLTIMLFALVSGIVVNSLS